jgi:hypothetical protein
MGVRYQLEYQVFLLVQVLFASGLEYQVKLGQMALGIKLLKHS